VEVAAKRDDYSGLTLLAPNGVAWHWVGLRWHVNRFGESVRLEEWQTPCRYCGAPFKVIARLAGGLRQQFLERRARARPMIKSGEMLDVRIRAPSGMRIKALELVNCRAHRWHPAPPAIRRNSSATL